MTSEARDIVERLMKATLYEGHGELSALPEEAAEEIRRLREALGPFAQFCAKIDGEELENALSTPDDRVIHPGLTVGHFRLARQALDPRP